MADKAISDLTPATQVTAADLFVLEQNNTAKKLLGQTLLNDLATALDGHGGINSIVYTAPVAPNLIGTLTITLADQTVYTVDVMNGNGITSITQYWAVSDDDTIAPSVWSTTLQTMTAENRYLWSYTTIAFSDGNNLDTTAQVIGVYGDKGDSWYVHIKYASSYPTQDSDIGDTPDQWVGIYNGTSATAPTAYTAYTWYGWKGPTGDTGNGIVSVTKTSSSGLADTYTVLFTDGNTSLFTVTNGSNISTITKTGTSGLQDTYTVLLTSGQTTTFTVTNAKSITSIAFLSNSGGGAQGSPGTYDIYQISYNNGDTSTFNVYNGANGAGSVARVDSISATGDNVELLTIGNSAPTSSTPGSPKSRYFDAVNSILYICVGSDGQGGYDWRGTGVTIDASLSSSSTNPVQNKVITGKIGTGTLSVGNDLTDGVNTLNTAVGDVSTLTTTATDLAGAVNELEGDIAALYPTSGTPAMDGTASRGSAATLARSDHVHPTDTSRQATITANGMLKGAGGGTISAATKGTDYGALSFTVTLSSSSWSSNAQTVSNANFITSGYAYIVSPASGSFTAYGAAQIYADDVTTTGQMTFHCAEVPTGNLTVNVVRMVSA